MQVDAVATMVDDSGSKHPSDCAIKPGVVSLGSNQSARIDGPLTQPLQSTSPSCDVTFDSHISAAAVFLTGYTVQ